VLGNSTKHLKAKILQLCDGKIIPGNQSLKSGTNPYRLFDDQRRGNKQNLTSESVMGIRLCRLRPPFKPTDICLATRTAEYCQLIQFTGKPYCESLRLAP